MNMFSKIQYNHGCLSTSRLWTVYIWIDFIVALYIVVVSMCFVWKVMSQLEYIDVWSYPVLPGLIQSRPVLSAPV